MSNCIWDAGLLILLLINHILVVCLLKKRHFS